MKRRTNFGIRTYIFQNFKGQIKSVSTVEKSDTQINNLNQSFMPKL